MCVLDSIGRNHTLQEVGYSLGVTSERIRQIEDATLSYLRHHLRPAIRSQEIKTLNLNNYPNNVGTPFFEEKTSQILPGLISRNRSRTD